MQKMYEMWFFFLEIVREKQSQTKIASVVQIFSETNNSVIIFEAVIAEKSTGQVVKDQIQAKISEKVLRISIEK